MKHFNKSEIERLLTHAKKDSARNWLMLLVAYNHGLRVSEVISLLGRDIRNGNIYVSRLKGSNSPVHKLRISQSPLFNEAEELMQLRDRVGQKGRLFPISRIQYFRIMQRYGLQLGFTSCHPHMLKHSIGRELVKKLGVEGVQVYLGHKNGNSTLVYLKPDESDVQTMVDEVMK